VVAVVVVLAALGAFTATSSAEGPPPREVTWFFSNRLASGSADFTIGFGPSTADAYLVGDWDGSGVDGIGIRRGSLFDQYNLQTGSTRTVSFGTADDEVFVGDWDGNGTDTFAVRRGNVFLIRNSVLSGPADAELGYGRRGDEVFVGDWDGNGTATFAVRRGNVFLIRNSVLSGPADAVFGFGRADDPVLVGDWNGDGKDTFAVRRGSRFFVRNDLRTGPAATIFDYGVAGDAVAVGDWDGNGTDTLVVHREGAVDIGTTVIPGSRIVAHYGSSASPLLGVLGESPPQEAAQRVVARARQWDGFGLPTVPAAEFIATIANASPGPSGDWSVRVPHNDIRPYIEAMRSVGGITVLDLQPGRTDFLTQAKEYEALLLEPDVHLALDPEWRMGPGQIPAQVIGSVDASEVNAVTAWLDDLVARNGLPPKLVVVHQFTPFMVTNRDQLAQRSHLTLLIHLDGFGSPEAKISKVEQLHPTPPLFMGFKLFLDEDTRLMSPSEVIGSLDPDPVYVSYQ